MKELLFRERFGVAQALLDAGRAAPTGQQWDVLDRIVIDCLDEPLPPALRGFKRYCEQMRRFGPRTGADWGLVKDAYQYMDNFSRWDDVVLMRPKRKPARKK